MRPDASENSQISPSTIVRAARAAGSHPHLASVLQQGRKSANIRVSSGVIRGIPVNESSNRRSRGNWCITRGPTPLKTASLVTLLLAWGAQMMSAANSRSKTSSPIRYRSARSKNESPKKKDGWDRAQIISGFISSVVIAIVGLLINNSIQRAQIAASKASSDAQIAASKANSEAQIEFTDRYNKAQLALTERTAEIQRHLQEGELIGKLVERLTSGSTLKKQIVIVVLRRSIPPAVYQDLITTIVKSDPDPEVRKTAIEQAWTLRDAAPSVAQAIDQAAQDASRPNEERQLATNAVHQYVLA